MRVSAQSKLTSRSIQFWSNPGFTNDNVLSVLVREINCDTATPDLEHILRAYCMPNGFENNHCFSNSCRSYINWGLYVTTSRTRTEQEIKHVHIGQRNRHQKRRSNRTPNNKRVCTCKSQTAARRAENEYEDKETLETEVLRSGTNAKHSK